MLKIFVLSGEYEKATVVASDKDEAKELVDLKVYTNVPIEDWRVDRTVELGDCKTKPQLVSYYGE